MLEVFKRDLSQSNKKLKKSGYILGLIYGPNLDQDIPIQIPKTPFLRFAETSNNNLSVDLLLDGEVRKCIITEIQSQPAFEGYTHINFKCIE
jgi:large subunit ribosomal protein L25